MSDPICVKSFLGRSTIEQDDSRQSGRRRQFFPFTFEWKTLIRNVVFPTELPIALTDSFTRDSVKLTQGKVSVSRNGLEGRAGELGQVVGNLAEFLGPPMIAAVKEERFECRSR